MNMAVTIKKLALDDLEAVWSLRLLALESSPEAFATTHSEALANGLETIRANLHPDNSRFRYLGAFTSKLVGMLGISRYGRLKDGHKADIVSMYVDSEHRGAGVGRKLMLAAINEARTMDGLEQLGLAVVTSNEAARRLYRSLGFQAWGIEPRALKVDNQYWDDEHMVLRL